MKPIRDGGNDREFIAILKMLPHALKLYNRFDVKPVEMPLRTNAGEHEKLWRVEGSATQNDLAPTINAELVLFPIVVVQNRGVRVGLVHVLALKAVDTRGAALARITL